MVDLATLVPAPHTVFAIEVGGFRLALTRSGGPVPARPLAIGALAGLGAATLALAGASAAPQPPMPIRYSVSQAVPELRVAHVAKPRVHPMAGRVRKPAQTPETFGEDDTPYVARAMATGDMQEWDAGGEHRFLTAGPARVEGGRTCRAMALLTRLADGGSHVRSADHCTTAPVSAAPADPIVAPDNALGGADQ